MHDRFFYLYRFYRLSRCSFMLMYMWCKLHIPNYSKWVNHQIIFDIVLIMWVNSFMQIHNMQIWLNSQNNKVYTVVVKAVTPCMWCLDVCDVMFTVQLSKTFIVQYRLDSFYLFLFVSHVISAAGKPWWGSRRLCWYSRLCSSSDLSVRYLASV